MIERKFRPTTVGELIASLQQFPAEQRVMVRGYESGYDDPEPLTIIHVRVDEVDSSVYGNYEGVSERAIDSFPVVLINRP